MLYRDNFFFQRKIISLDTQLNSDGEIEGGESWEIRVVSINES